MSFVTFVANLPSVIGSTISAQSMPVTLASDDVAVVDIATIAASQGMPASGIAYPSGGIGILGWLSGIYKVLSNPMQAIITSAFTPTINTLASSILASTTDYVILPINPGRRMMCFQNTHATASIYLNFGAAAYSVGSYSGFVIAAGQLFILDVAVPNSPVHVASSIAGVPFFVLEG